MEHEQPHGVAAVQIWGQPTSDRSCNNSASVHMTHVNSDCRITRQTKKKTRQECRCYRDDTFRYLLQLSMPPLLADDLTMENHRGGAQTERRVFPRAALHKRLQVRVQLQREGGYWSVSCQSVRDSASKPITPTHNMNR